MWYGCFLFLLFLVLHLFKPVCQDNLMSVGVLDNFSAINFRQFFLRPVCFTTRQTLSENGSTLKGKIVPPKWANFTHSEMPLLKRNRNKNELLLLNVFSFHLTLYRSRHCGESKPNVGLIDNTTGDYSNIWRDLIKPSLCFSFFCELFVSKGNLSDFIVKQAARMPESSNVCVLKHLKNNNSILQSILPYKSDNSHFRSVRYNVSVLFRSIRYNDSDKFSAYSCGPEGDYLRGYTLWKLFWLLFEKGSTLKRKIVCLRDQILFFWSRPFSAGTWYTWS